MLGSDHSIVNTVVFDFDALVDYKIGIVRTLQKNIDSISGVNKEYLLRSTLNDLKLDRIYTIEDIVYKSLDKNNRDQYQNFIDYILSSDYESDCYEYSVPTKLFNLINTYKKSGTITIDILCRNKIQKQFIESKSKSLSQNIIICPRSEMMIEKYGVIYLGYFKHVLELPKFELKHFVVPGFRENFEEENGQIMKYILPYTDINKFGFVDPYIKIEQPIG